MTHRLLKEYFERVEARGLTIQTASRLARMPRGTVECWQDGYRNPRIDRLDAAGAALGGKLVWVWDDDR